MDFIGIQRYRLAFTVFMDQGHWTDSITNRPMQITSGSAMQIEFGLRAKSYPEEYIDAATLSSLTLQIKKIGYGEEPPEPGDANSIEPKTTTQFDSLTITPEQWAAGSEQHVTFPFTAAEIALNDGIYWLILSGVNTDGKSSILGWGRVDIVQAGAGPVTPLEPLPESYLTATQIYALLPGLQPGEVVSQLLGFWTLQPFDASSAELVDASESGNNALLKTGRAFDFNKQFGSGTGNFQTQPYAQGVHKLRILCKAASPTSFNVLEVAADPGQGISFSRRFTISTDWNWRIFTFETYTGNLSVTDPILIAVNNSSTFDGQIAVIEFYDINDNLVDIQYLNSFDSSVTDLTTKTFYGVNGGSMSYVGESSARMVEQLEAPVPQIAALDYNIVAGQLIVKHLTDDTDATGNPLNFKRPTETTFNTPPDGVIEIPNIAEYSTVRTVFMWYYHDETDKTIASLGTPQITVSGDAISASGITDPIYSVNGSVGSALTAGWNFIAVISEAAFAVDAVLLSGKCDKFFIYADAKDALFLFEFYSTTKADYVPDLPDLPSGEPSTISWATNDW